MKYCTLWVVFFLCCFSPGYAVHKISFEHIDLEKGLSHHSVLSIAQDSLGIMWFGTRNGLNKYDGNTITTYYAQHDNPNSLLENHIRKIKTKGSKLWIQTPGSISCYDIIKEKFDNYNIDEAKTFEIDNGFVWVATGTGLHKLFLPDKRLQPVKTGIPPKVEYKALLKFPKGVLIGTSDGLYSLDEKGETTLLLPSVNVTNLFLDSKNNIWVGTRSEWAFRISPTGEVTHYGKNVLSHEFVRCFTEDRQGFIWIGTLVGLDRLDVDTRATEHYTYNASDPSQLSHSSIWSLYTDRQETIWVGTFFGGVNVFNPTGNTFQYYPVNSTDHSGLNFRVVGSMCNWTEDKLWICVEGAGLNLYDRKTGSFLYFSHIPGNPASLSCNNTKAVVNQGDTLLWVATHTGGLNRYDAAKKRFTSLANLPSHKENIPSNDVLSIIPCRDRYILATYDGVMWFDPKTEEVSRMFTDPHYDKIAQDALAVMWDGRYVWIGTQFSGLIRYEPATGDFRQFHMDSSDKKSITSDLINSIFLDRRGNIWVATPNGLNLYRPDSDDFEHFSTSDGLPGDLILNLIDSHHGSLLISTTRGISIFDYARRKFTNYTRDNGLLLDEINQNALFRASDGEVFVGGFNGMVSFNDQDLAQAEPNNKIKITGLRVNNRPVSATGDNRILHQNIMMCDRIDLYPRQTIFTLTFSDMGLTQSKKLPLSYKLQGFDQDWLTADATNSATYTNLRPGRYTFRVRYLNAPEDTASEAILAVHIHPPFYFKWWAFVFYALVVGAIVAYLSRINLMKRKAEYELSIQEIEHNREAEYNQAKMRFFTNVSHEFRTPLTLITGNAETLLNTQISPKSVYPKLQDIYRNSTQLKELITELLDFRSQELGHMKIKVVRKDLVSFLYEIYSCFKEYASSQKINFYFEKETEQLYVWFDPKNMLKVINNLLANAFKYTQESGTITLRVKEADGMAVIEVADTGCGIAPDILPRIFDRFFQADHNGSFNISGTGIGLSLSKSIVELHHGTIQVSSQEDEGTLFTVNLQLNNEHFDPSQIAEEQITGFDTFNPELFKVEEVPKDPKTGEMKKKKILIVEDNDPLRGMLADIFSNYYTVLEAPDGEQAYGLVKTDTPDIVVSDIMMPKMSGIELCKAIKSDIDICHIPVVLLTAKAAVEHNMEGLQAGADDYISKPFNISLLISRCNNLINNRLLLQEKFGKQPGASEKMLATNPLDEKFISKVIQYIYANLDNPELSIEGLTREIGMSRTTFFEKIKAISGQTPNEFINTIRLKESASLLRNNPELSIVEISDKVGFSSQKYFSRCFKNSYDISPSAYRQQMIASTPQHNNSRHS